MEIPGYAYYDPDDKFKKRLRKRYTELMEDETVSLEVTERDYQFRKNYYKGNFKGNINETDITILVSNCSIPFGGRVHIMKPDEFICYIYTE